MNIESFKNQLYKLYGINPSNDNSSDEIRESIKVLNKSILVNSSNENFNEMSENVASEKYQDSFLLCPYIILDFSAVNYIDTNAVKGLLEVRSLLIYRNVFPIIS